MIDTQDRPEAGGAPLPSETGGAEEARSVLDLARMHDLRSSLGEGLRDVIEVYLEDTPGRIEEISAAGCRKDHEVVQRIAHSLKSSSGIFGAQAMVECCQGIERAAALGQPASDAEMQALHAAFQNIQSVLNSYLTNL